MKTFSTQFTLVSIFSILLISYSIDKTLDNIEITSAYFPLALGNYWEFEVESYNSATFTGLVRPNPEILKVVDYEAINAELYYKLERKRSSSNVEIIYLRDSSGYIIDDNHTVWFSAIDRNIILNQRGLDIWDSPFIEYSVPDSVVYAFTPLGEFKCLDFQGCMWISGEHVEKKIHNYYSNGVGPVYQRVVPPSLNSTIETRKRLINYQIYE